MTDVGININPRNIYPFNSEENVTIQAHKDIELEVKKAIKKYIWTVAGKLSFDEILYFGLSLIEKFQLISYIIRAEFPYIMIDEYQDTNPIQNRIIDLLCEKESSVVVVGDIAQSIYSFQGATYKEFHNFNLSSNKELVSKAIEGNRRSTKNIIQLINFIRKCDSGFVQECTKNIDNNEKVTFLIQKDKNLNVSFGNLIKPNTRILCRKWAEAFKYIDDISDEQKQLINNIYNAYTYAANRDFRQEIESKREAWISSTLDIAKLESAFKNKNLPSALEVFSKYFDIRDIFKNFEKTKLHKLQSIIRSWENIFSKDLDDLLLKDVIELINNEFNNITDIDVLESFKYPIKESDEYFEPVYKHTDTLTYSCSKKIVLDLFSENSKHMTIHQSKGREFDSVLVNMEPFANEKKEGIEPVNIFINPKIIGNGSEGTYEEYTRVAYVGCSRAINKLYIHINGNESTAEAIKESLTSFAQDNGNQTDFFDFVYC